MQLSISNPKTGKAYSKKIDDIGIFLNKKLGEIVELSAIGMQGYKAKICGGSDKCGFPMHPSISGSTRKRVFIAGGIGFRPENKGQRRRTSIRGNVIGTDISQLNLSIIEFGEKNLDVLFATAGKQIEEKKSIKEEMVERSLAEVGKVELAEEAKKIKGKAKG